jgi:hypothetical protein
MELSKPLQDIPSWISISLSNNYRFLFNIKKDLTTNLQVLKKFIIKIIKNVNYLKPQSLK